MTKNPFINALCATLYIALFATFITFAPPDNQIPMPLAPILFLSLFVFSAAVMSYIVLYQPALLFFESKHKEAVTLFMQTLGFFALNTIVIVGAGLLLF
jgi:hypothetical protein